MTARHKVTLLSLESCYTVLDCQAVIIEVAVLLSLMKAFNFDAIIELADSEENFLQLFQEAFSQQEQPFCEAHRTIWAACYKNPGLAPTLKADSPFALAQAWMKRYRICSSSVNGR